MLEITPHSGLVPSYNQDLRTEDIKFSPSGRVLAAVATADTISLFAVDTAVRPIAIGRQADLTSPSLSSPHGVDFLSEDVIAVANRSGWVTFYRLPPMEAWRERMPVEPLHEMKADWFGDKGASRRLGQRHVRCGPGSVRVRGKQLFVCCNNKNTVSVHPYQLAGDSITIGDGRIIAQAGLEIPDGIALSRDGLWMAIGDHGHLRVVIYNLADGTETAVLRDDGLGTPHGMCFDPLGRSLYVADAGNDQLHVFVSGGAWDRSQTSSAFRLSAVDADVFRKTKEAVPERRRPLEGGIKGLDVDPSGRVLATTCRHQTLRFMEILPLHAEMSLVH
jgi:DNA-binding beta-propeller fold protein YncE